MDQVTIKYEAWNWQSPRSPPVGYQRATSKQQTPTNYRPGRGLNQPSGEDQPLQTIENLHILIFLNK